MSNDVMNFLETASIEDVKLTPADEAAIFLAALEDACETPEEFNQLVMENATELELYQLIPDASIVTEAKKIVYKQTKAMNLGREQSKAALRMAKNANTADWKKYQRGRQMMLEARENIFNKFQGKAKQEAKKVVSGAKRKASSMNSTTGKSITEKMDKKIKEMGN